MFVFFYAEWLPVSLIRTMKKKVTVLYLTADTLLHAQVESALSGINFHAEAVVAPCPLQAGELLKQHSCELVVYDASSIPDCLDQLAPLFTEIPVIVLMDDSIEALRSYADHSCVDDCMQRSNLSRLPYAIINLIEKYVQERQRSYLIKEVSRHQKEGEKALKDMTDRLLLATRAAGLAMYDYRIEADELTFTDEVLELVGRKRSELGASLKTWFHVFHPDDLPMIMEKVEECKNTQKNLALEYRIIMPDGSFKYIRNTAYTQCILDGKEHKITGTLQDITREKLEQQRLEANEEKYRSIFQNSMDAILFTQPTGIILDANQAATRIFGRSVEEIRACSRQDLMVLDEEAARLFALREKTGSAKGIVTLKRKDGSLFHAEISSTIFENVNGEEFSTIIVRDISEKERLQQTIVRERERFNDLFMEAPSCVVVLRGRELVFELANPYFLQLTGRSNDIIGKPAREVMTELHCQGIFDVIENVYNTGENFYGKNVKVEFDIEGSGKLASRFLDLILIPHRSENGQVSAIFFFSNDVTDEVLLRNAMEESEENYRKMFDLSPLPKLLVEEATLKLLQVNYAATRQFGYSLENFKEMTFGQLFSGAGKANLEHYLAHVSEQEEIVKMLEHLYSSSGVEMKAELSAVKFTYKKKPCYLITINDLTDRIALQNDLTRLKVSAQKKMLQSQIRGQEYEREFIGRELHDNINQQLCTIQLYLGLIRQDELRRDEMLNWCDAIVRSTIQDIRKLSRAIVPPMIKEVGFNSAVRELVESFSRAQKFTLHLKLSRSLNKLNHNLQLALFRVVQEQLTNISKYAKAQHVWISGTIEKGVLQLQIRDDGVGFDVKEVKKGIGLANIRNRVEAFDGSVRIKSSPGRGCLLQVVMRLKLAEAQSNGLAIVVADDDLLDQELLHKAAQDVDVQHRLHFVTTACQMMNHLESLKDEQLPALLVIDMHLPGLNGFQLLERLRQHKRYASIPKVIYSTALLTEDKSLKADDVKAIIRKGSSMDEIKDNFREMISHCLPS